MMEQLFEHEVFGKIAHEPVLKHRHVEAFYENLRGQALDEHSSVYSDGAIVKIACDVGVITQQIDVPESDPALINWLALQVVTYVNQARQLPKN